MVYDDTERHLITFFYLFITLFKFESIKFWQFCVNITQPYQLNNTQFKLSASHIKCWYTNLIINQSINQKILPFFHLVKVIAFSMFIILSHFLQRMTT